MPMYIEAVPNRGSPPAILLRESYREGAKIKKRTLANLTDWPSDLVEGFRTLLKGGAAIPPDQEAFSLAVPRPMPICSSAPESVRSIAKSSANCSGLYQGSTRRFQALVRDTAQPRGRASLRDWAWGNSG